MRATLSQTHSAPTDHESEEEEEEEVNHEEHTLTRRRLSSAENAAKMFCTTSPIPAESTPAMLGESQASQTRQRSVLRWMRVLPIWVH